MPEIKPAITEALSSRSFTRLRWFLAPIKVVFSFFVLMAVVWASLAIYSNLPWASARLVLATSFGVFASWAFFLNASRSIRLTASLLFLFVLLWFVLIPASHQRAWRPEVARLPSGRVNGDTVHLYNVRDFDYRSRDDFIPRYVEREVSLSHLTSVDLFLSYWKIGPVAHTFVSFNFENAAPICISIEIRPEQGESFARIPALFKQFELIYVVGNETDLVRVRSNYRGEEVYLYPIRVSAEAARRLFLIYVNRINKLAEQAEFYNLLSNNCTINIVRYSNAAGRQDGLNYHFLFNGLVDQYIYQVGLVDTSIPFTQLRERSRIADRARAANSDSDFSTAIRRKQPR
jgi:hypothetical protein